MTPEKLKNPEAQQLLELAVISMKTAVAGFHDFPNVENLMTTALQVWTDVKSDEELRVKIDDDIRQKGKILEEMKMTDITGGDIVRRRYDPYEWQKNIPREFKNREGEWILERSESLLTLLEALNSKE